MACDRNTGEEESHSSWLHFMLYGTFIVLTAAQVGNRVSFTERGSFARTPIDLLLCVF